MISNRVMRRQPKAIYRIRKLLTSPSSSSSSSSRIRRQRDHGSNSELSDSSSSTDSFTPSEKRAVLAATLHYNHTHFDHRHYEEGLSIEEFMGRPQERRFHSIPPVIRYNSQTDSFRSRPERNVARRSASVSSGSSAFNPRLSGVERDKTTVPLTLNGGAVGGDGNVSVKTDPSSSEHSGTVAVENVLEEATAVGTGGGGIALSSLSGTVEHVLEEATAVGTSGGGGSVLMKTELSSSPAVSRQCGTVTVEKAALGEATAISGDIVDTTPVFELAVPSNPHISERTGFAGDTILPSFTPVNSVT